MALLENWRLKYPSLIHSPPEKIIVDISEFHHAFVSIHPFLDMNGRVARAILLQQAHELLHRNISVRFSSEPKVYYEALQVADKGDLQPLITLIQSCLE